MLRELSRLVSAEVRDARELICTLAQIPANG